jgi:hypothetical protein
LDTRLFGAGSVQPLPKDSQPGADPGLLLLEEVERHRTGVVGLQQAGLFVAQPVPFPLEHLALALSAAVHVGQVAAQHVDHRVRDLGWQRDAGVLAFDLAFHPVDEDGLAGASGPFAVTAGADEVPVGHAVAVGAVSDDQAAVAATAVDAALEVVVVCLLPVTGTVVGCSDGLNALPGGGIDDGLMPARVAHAAVDHLAQVVRVGQQLVQAGDRQRLSGTLRRWPGREAPQRQFFQQHGDRPLALGVGVEGPTDQWCPLRVHVDGADVAAKVVGDADVAVAERCDAYGAAGLCLLAEPLGDLTG